MTKYFLFFFLSATAAPVAADIYICNGTITNIPDSDHCEHIDLSDAPYKKVEAGISEDVLPPEHELEQYVAERKAPKVIPRAVMEGCSCKALPLSQKQGAHATVWKPHEQFGGRYQNYRFLCEVAGTGRISIKAIYHTYNGQSRTAWAKTFDLSPNGEIRSFNIDTSVPKDIIDFQLVEY